MWIYYYNMLVQLTSLVGLNYLSLSSKFQIKKLDPASKRVSTLAGTGKAGFKDGTALAAQVGKYL
jgi:hypothetical protein